MDSKLVKYFGALANPKRLAIVEALAAGEMTFSQIMEAASIVDSSSLVFHLNKLEGIVGKRDGIYSLTERGRHLHRFVNSFPEPGSDQEERDTKVHPGSRSLLDTHNLSRISAAWLYRGGKMLSCDNCGKYVLAERSSFDWLVVGLALLLFFITWLFLALVPVGAVGIGIAILDLILLIFVPTYILYYFTKKKDTCPVCGEKIYDSEEKRYIDSLLQ